MRENFARKILPNDMQPAATRRGSNSLSHPKKTSFFQGTRTSIQSPPLADGWRQRVRFTPLFLHTKKATESLGCFAGADDEARTRYLHLGKVALYQMSYIRKYWCLRAESNHRHGDFQSPALPTELQRQRVFLLLIATKRVSKTPFLMCGVKNTALLQCSYSIKHGRGKVKNFFRLFSIFCISGNMSDIQPLVILPETWYHSSISQ